VLLPLAAAGLYALLGSPAALEARATRVATQQDVEKMVSDLAERMAKDPSDPKGWIVLARSYRVMNRLPQAEDAFNHIGEPLFQNATLLAEYADVLATRAMGNFDGKPMEMVKRALALDPQNPMALSLSATAAYNRNDLAGAVAQWERLLTIVPPDSDDAKWLSEAVTKTRAQMGAPATTAQAASGTADKKDKHAAAVDQRSHQRPCEPGSLRWPAKVQPTDTVFVFARSPQGPRMPLGRAARSSVRPAVRLQARRLDGHEPRVQDFQRGRGAHRSPHLEERQRDAGSGRFDRHRSGGEAGRQQGRGADRPGSALNGRHTDTTNRIFGGFRL
jgi:cytochrome c-type biogenesis protein CcmH